jgi:S-adenosylmethionine:tRNA ribosyltransferase-isomerase
VLISEHRPIQRSPHARLLVINRCGRIRHAPRQRFVEFLRPGDLVIANDAATLPASLKGEHVPTCESIEVRLAGRRSLDSEDIQGFSAIVFGAGDFHTPTEERPPPPRLRAGDRLVLGPLTAVVERVLGHPRLVSLRFESLPDAFWAGLARHGRPIQYAHVPTPLALWDVWTPLAGPPVAFEPPSAGFALDWQSIAAIRARGIAFATITHAAGISSTGDDQLDRRLPFAEPYRIPETTALAIARARADRGRVVAIGTTVVRALEHAASRDGVVRPGDGLATQRIHANSRLRIVEAVLSGIHEPGTSHYELLRAFTGDDTLRRADHSLEVNCYRTHEFGDSVFVESSWEEVMLAGQSGGSGDGVRPRSQIWCRTRDGRCSCWSGLPIRRIARS